MRIMEEAGCTPEGGSTVFQASRGMAQKRASFTHLGRAHQNGCGHDCMQEYKVSAATLKAHSRAALMRLMNE